MKSIRLLITVVTIFVGLQLATPAVFAQKQKKSAPSAKAKGKNPWKVIVPGVKRMETQVGNDSLSSRRLWIYLPTSYKPGQKIPCILIAPAGTRGFHGIRLGTSDQAEHVPYVRAGFAVVAYEIDGPIADSDVDDDAKVLQAVHRFSQANSGVYNAKAALDGLMENATFLDKQHIYVAGHSSAATLALQVAASDDRVAGCIAYAPEVDMVGHLAPALNMLEGHEPGFQQMITKLSPNNNAAAIKCPLFLFHANDDGVVSGEDIADFARAVERTNPRVTYVTAPTGGHFKSMILAGIPAAIQWLKKNQ